MNLLINYFSKEFEKQINEFFSKNQRLDDWSMFVAQGTEIGGMKLKLLSGTFGKVYFAIFLVLLIFLIYKLY